LLRWGGDKNCKVIFTSEPESKYNYKIIFYFISTFVFLFFI